MDLARVLTPDPRSDDARQPAANTTATAAPSWSPPPPGAPTVSTSTAGGLFRAYGAAVPPLSPPPSMITTAKRVALGRSRKKPLAPSSLPSTITTTPAAAAAAAATLTAARVPAKRKRKPRLSAKQIQVAKENQQDQSLLLNLTLDINDLKQQIRDCLARKSVHETRMLLQRQRLCGAVLRATEHVFHLFRTGHRAWEPREAAFFATTIDDRLVINSVVTGVDVFFEQWRRYKKLLHTRCFRIDSTRMLVSEADSCVVECKGEFEGRLTLDAVQTLFPHILADADLLARVVDCRLVCPTRTLIYFDASARIVQYDAHADMFAGLSRILASNPVDVFTLMAHARISAEGSMIPDADDNHVGGGAYCYGTGSPASSAGFDVVDGEVLE